MRVVRMGEDIKREIAEQVAQYIADAGRVWIVSETDYYEGQILGAFTTEEAARRFAGGFAEFDPAADCDVFAVEVNPEPPPPSDRFYYTILIREGGGDTIKGRAKQRGVLPGHSIIVDSVSVNDYATKNVITGEILAHHGYVVRFRGTGLSDAEALATARELAAKKAALS